MTSEPLSRLTTESITSGLRWLVGELINLGVTEIDSNRYKFDFWTANPVYVDNHRGLTIRWAQYNPLEITGVLPTTGQWITDLQDCLRVARVDIEDGIIRRYWAGERYARIAQDIGWSRDYVKDVLVKVGGPVGDARVDDETLSAISEMVNDGLSYKKISRTLNVDKETIIAYFGPSTYHKTPEDKLHSAEQMIDDGAPYEEIARTLKISKHTLTKYFGPSLWKPGRGEIIRMANDVMERVITATTTPTCRNGHLLAGENAYPYGNGLIRCRTCKNESNKKYAARKRKERKNAGV